MLQRSWIRLWSMMSDMSDRFMTYKKYWNKTEQLLLLAEVFRYCNSTKCLDLGYYQRLRVLFIKIF